MRVLRSSQPFGSFMVVDREQLKSSLRSFYDFSGKVVLYVGAAHGQLLDPSRTKKRILVDQNAAALEQLRAASPDDPERDAVEIIVASFDRVSRTADVVYFEFCLHEMPSPAAALVQARSLAPDVIVFEHAVGSKWSYYAGEDEDVRRSAAALQEFNIRRQQTVLAEQHFRDYGELIAKLRPQGAIAMERARHFADTRDILIPMPCQLVQI